MFISKNERERREREKTQLKEQYDRLAKMPEMSEQEKIQLLQYILRIWSGTTFFLCVSIFITGIVLAIIYKNEYFLIMSCIFPVIIGSFFETFLFDRFNINNKNTYNDKNDETDKQL